MSSRWRKRDAQFFLLGINRAVELLSEPQLEYRTHTRQRILCRLDFPKPARIGHAQCLRSEIEAWALASRDGVGGVGRLRKAR
jgi:hypothetical protein